MNVIVIVLAFSKMVVAPTAVLELDELTVGLLAGSAHFVRRYFTLLTGDWLAWLA